MSTKTSSQRNKKKKRTVPTLSNNLKLTKSLYTDKLQQDFIGVSFLKRQGHCDKDNLIHIKVSSSNFPIVALTQVLTVN